MLSLALSMLALLASEHTQAAMSTYELTGEVLDSQGRTLQSTRIWISQDRRIQTTDTDEHGRFEFDTVAVGPVEVIAFQEGYAVGGLKGEIIQSAHIKLVLAPPSEITLRVINPENQPIPGARIKSLFIANTFSVPVEDIVQYGFPPLRSDAQGFIRIPFIPEGSNASFSVAHRRYAEQVLPTLPAGSNLDVRLPFGIRLRGRITNLEGQGLSRTRVSLYRGNREFTEVMSDPEGFYSAIVPQGVYHVAARRMDHAIPDPTQAEWAPGADEAILDIALLPPHVITGTFVDTEGEPVSGTRVTYIARNKIFSEVVSDQSGQFRIIAASGDGNLHITPPAHMITDGNPNVALHGLEDSSAITLNPIQLKPLPSIKGTVTSRKDVPLKNVLVSTQGIRPTLRALTDADGSFEIQLSEMPRDARVALRAEHSLRFLRHEEWVDLTKNDTVQLRMNEYTPELDTPLEVNSNKMQAMVGKPAPDLRCDTWFNIPSTKEDGIRLSDLRGKVVVLTFWAGWDNKAFGSTPDRLDELNYLYRIFEEQDDVVFINIHEGSTSPLEIREHIQRFKTPFAVARDEDPALTFDIYNVNTIPQTVLIDRQGILRYFEVEYRLHELIKDLRRRS